jgi:putative endonuclease
MSKGFVYILFSQKDKKTYTGSTDDIEKRIKEHENGYCKATMHRRPLQLIRSETFDTLTEARKRERYLKTAAGRKQLKKILKNILGE